MIILTDRAGMWGKLRISSLALHFKQELRDTIMHELLHLMPGGNGHRGLWQERADKINEKYGYHITVAESGTEEKFGKEFYDYLESLSKYRVTCDKCGYSWFYERKGKTVKNYFKITCPCGGALHLRVLK